MVSLLRNCCCFIFPTTAGIVPIKTTHNTHKGKDLQVRNHTPPKDAAGKGGDNNLEVNKEKVKVVFMRIDKDGNGKIDKTEFFNFLQGLGLAVDQKESDSIFETVDEDGNGFVFFNEFYNYFVKVVLGEAFDPGLCAAFLAADRDGSGTVNFHEFTEYAMSQRQEMSVAKLLEAFKQLDNDNSGEIDTKEFLQMFNKDAKGILCDEFSSSTKPQQQSGGIGDVLQGLYDESEAADLASFLSARWEKFAGFSRAGASGKTVMTGGDTMVDDVAPGEYNLIDLACFNDLPPVEPKHIVAKVTWVKSTTPGESGRLIFPEEFDGRLPTVIATNETLAYYGASLADKNQCKVSLLYRHGIQDFTYENNYLEDYVTQRGAGIERHEFVHLDCPMDDDSGFFILGKLEHGEELYLTAFKVLPRQTLYVPAQTIHSNDYLKGTWRTMLSDEADIDHVQLNRWQQGSQEPAAADQKFHFTFEQLM